MPNRPPAIDGVLETVIYARDLPRSVTFYHDILGFPVLAGDDKRFHAVHPGGRQVFLIFQHGATLEPAPAPRGGMIPPHDSTGQHHVGFAISAESYEAWKQHLIGHGVPIESEAHWARGGRSMYFRDPDGHLLELVTPGIWPNY